jgi:hypothetical protein
MWKWLAPFLLLTAKPEVLLRAVTAVMAAAVVAFGVWLLSNIAVTFDTLKNTYIAIAYGVVLLLFLITVGSVAWLRLRRPLATAPVSRLTSQPDIPLPTEVVSRRAETISKQWERANRLPAGRIGDAATLPKSVQAPVAPEPQPLPARATLLVTGPAFSGKTALINVLVEATSANPPQASDIVRLVDAGPVEPDERQLAELAARAAAADGVLFVVDQDLRAPEAAAIKRFLATSKPLYVVLTKADQFTAADRDAILVAIRAKLPAAVAPGSVVSIAGAPSPVERHIEDARGAVRVEQRLPASDIRALTNLLTKVFAPRAGRPLRFEAA